MYDWIDINNKQLIYNKDSVNKTDSRSIRFDLIGDKKTFLLEYFNSHNAYGINIKPIANQDQASKGSNMPNMQFAHNYNIKLLKNYCVEKSTLKGKTIVDSVGILGYQNHCYYK